MCIKALLAITLLGANLAYGMVADGNDIAQSISTSNDTVETSRQSRDYSYYEDDYKNKYHDKYPGYAMDYAPYTGPTYPSLAKEEPISLCPTSSLGPLFNNGLQFLLLKLGAIGILKSILAIVAVLMVFKLPILLAKVAFFKAAFFPALVAPFMMLFSNLLGNSNMMMNMMTSTTVRPTNRPSGNNFDGRALDDSIGSATWQSIRFLLDSQKCAERIACNMGSLNSDSASGAALSRMAKYLEQASPKDSRGRIRSLRDAFSEGNDKGDCTSSSFPCDAPHIYLSQGGTNMKVF